MGARTSRRDRAIAALAALIALVGATGAVAAAVVVSQPAAVHLGTAPRPHALSAATRLAGTPVAVRIPAIGVDAALVTLGLDADGALEVPAYDRAGWFGGGAKPGEPGPAVIAAHVDSRTGPAVFYRLRALRVGDPVRVDYDDGTTESFVVTGADSYAKSDFPTARVYGPTPGPELRLITCAGRYDRRAGSYADNLVVWAAPASTEDVA